MHNSIVAAAFYSPTASISAGNIFLSSSLVPIATYRSPSTATIFTLPTLIFIIAVAPCRQSLPPSALLLSPASLHSSSSLGTLPRRRCPFPPCYRHLEQEGNTDTSPRPLTMGRCRSPTTVIPCFLSNLLSAIVAAPTTIFLPSSSSLTCHCCRPLVHNHRSLDPCGFLFLCRLQP
ncbi:hypothetical protein BHE74_00043937 [Ensete ventricosum]|nr:hypothetical protein BHE74_00043937 [Ensete ventricosum]